MALEANMVSEWLNTPTTYLNPLGGMLFTFFYLIVLKWGENTLGVSLNEGRPSPTSKSPLQDLFRSDSDFKEFQLNTLKRIKTRWNWVIAGLITIMIIGGYYHDLLIDPVHYRVAKEWSYYSLSGPAGIVTTVIFPWLVIFLVGTIIVGSCMVLRFVFSISEIGKERGVLAISGLETHEQRDEPSNNDQENEVREFTLKRFEQKSRIIPSITVRIFIIMVVGVGILNFIGLTVLFVLHASNPNQAINAFFIILISILDIFLIPITFFVFFYPQLAIKDLIEVLKDEELTTLELLFKKKKSRYLTLIEQNKDVDTTYNQFKTLEQMIDETEALNVWPFNYRHFITFLMSTVIYVSSMMINVISLLLLM